MIKVDKTAKLFD